MPGVLSWTRSFHVPLAGIAEASTVNVLCSYVVQSGVDGHEKVCTGITRPSSLTRSIT
jgi:hypothetical protein